MREEHIEVTRHARVCVLGEPQSALEVWIVCHGYGQLATSFIEEFAHVASDTLCVVAPEASYRFYIDPPPAPAAQRRVGATWMTREDRETDIVDYIAYLDEVHRRYVRDGTKVRALGFSQGAATVARWAARTTLRYDQLIAWGSDIPNDVTLATDANIIAVRGKRDEYLKDVEFTCPLIEFDGGHRMDRSVLAQIAAQRIP
jgi:predicted esterase